MAEKLTETLESVVEKAAEDLFRHLEPYVRRLARVERFLENKRPWMRAYR